jgi:hypothetical protein
MSTRWLLFIIATVTLLAPLPAFYSRKRRYRTLLTLDIERRNGSWWLTWKQVLRFGGHWIELARGLGASFGMLSTIDELRTVSRLYETHASWARAVLPLVVAILCVVLIALLFRYPGKSVAPIAFVIPTLLVLVPVQVSLPAILLGAVCSLSLRSLSLFFVTAAPSLAILGYLLDRQLWPSVAGALLAAVPVIFAFGQHREMVIPVRRPN